MAKQNANRQRRGREPRDSKPISQSFGKSKYSRGNSGSTARSEVIMDKLTHNDPAYYNKNSGDYTAAMAIPWFKIIGDRTGMEKAIPPSIIQSLGENVTLHEHKFPTIMAIDVVPSIGACDGSALNPVNKCFTMMFNELAAKTTNANIGFQMPDLAMYLTSMSSIQALLAYAKKVLGTTNFWRTKNISYPMALTTAHGFRWSEISGQRTQYVSRLNDLIRMFNSMRVPHFTEVFDRQYAMMNSVFIDEDDDFGQIYTFRPKGYYRYLDTEMKCAWTECSFYDSSVGDQFADLLADIESALQAWYQSDDYRLINGALLRAYGDVSTYVIETADMESDITPTTDKYFLMQIMNMDIIPYHTLSNLDIIQDETTVGGLITWQPISTSDRVPTTTMDHFLRIYSADASLDDNCEMTRLCTVWQAAQNDLWMLESSGTELVVGIELYSVGSTAQVGDSECRIESNFDFVMSEALLGDVMKLQAFRYLPFLPNLEQTGPYDAYLHGCLGDVYNYTSLPNNILSHMHEVAMYSIWKPSITAKVY